jgi:hypothetical protein
MQQLHLRGVLSNQATEALCTPIVAVQRAPFALTRPETPLFTRWIEAKELLAASQPYRPSDAGVNYSHKSPDGRAVHGQGRDLVRRAYSGPWISVPARRRGRCWTGCVGTGPPGRTGTAGRRYSGGHARPGQQGAGRSGPTGKRAGRARRRSACARWRSAFIQATNSPLVTRDSAISGNVADRIHYNRALTAQAARVIIRREVLAIISLYCR